MLVVAVVEENFDIEDFLLVVGIVAAAAAAVDGFEDSVAIERREMCETVVVIGVVVEGVSAVEALEASPVVEDTLVSFASLLMASRAACYCYSKDSDHFSMKALRDSRPWEMSARNY